MKKTTILVIDDHKLIRDAWSMAFSHLNKFHMIEHAGEIENVVEIARKSKPDIVLLDLNIGLLYGFEMLKKIRKYSPASKVIAVSIHLQPNYAKRTLNSGARAYISKNSPAEELLKAIEEVLAGNTYISEDVRNMVTKQWESDQENFEGNIDLLSTRELQIIKLIRNGYSSKMIAEELHIGAKTVEVHRHNILKKLKVKNTAVLIDLINAHGL